MEDEKKRYTAELEKAGPTKAINVGIASIIVECCTLLSLHVNKQIDRKQKIQK